MEPEFCQNDPVLRISKQVILIAITTKTNHRILNHILNPVAICYNGSVKKTALSQLFLYRYRYHIGFFLLAVAYIAVLFGLPLLAPAGLSEAEMESVAHSYALNFDSIFRGDIVDLPYRALQKLSIMLFGLNVYAIKLPSIIIGLFLGLLLILLLNRWFKNSVALLASILAVLSASFLFLAGSGTPLIMLVFWPTLLLWLGSKIQGVTKPKPLYCFVFAFALLASIFTPHLIYLAAFIVLFAVLHPHLRFTIKTLPTIPLILTLFIILMGLAALGVAIVVNPVILPSLLWTPGLDLAGFIENIKGAFIPLFAWNTTLESQFLSPFVGLASIALAVIGLLSTTKGFFASRNSIATCLIIFTIFLAGLNPESAILILLPLAILIAHGFRYILDKWYNLFPDNPYARISAALPIGLFMGIMITGGITHFLFGYHYVPMVADEFNNDLTIVSRHLNHGETLYVTNSEIEYNFFKVLEDNDGTIKVANTIPADADLPASYATLGAVEIKGELKSIITSSKSENSDRIYTYTSVPVLEDEIITEEKE